MSRSPLEPVLVDVRRRAAERRRRLPLERLKDLVRADSFRRERFLAGFQKGEIGVIAELKRRSLAGEVLLREADEPGATLPTREPRLGARMFALALSFRDGGAAAISVATEQDRFGGSLDDLRAVEFTRLPRLRRDFVLDEAMLWETCLYGADAVVLLPAILEQGTLAELRGVARELGLAVLVEVHGERELERAAALEPELLAVAARDPATLEVDLEIVERLLPAVPAGSLRVASGGLATLADLERVRAAGADAVLVGAALARDPDPEATLRSWKRAFGGGDAALRARSP